VFSIKIKLNKEDITTKKRNNNIIEN